MFTTFKRWSLKDGFLQLVGLPVRRHLGLLRIEGTSSYLATQYWESHAARDTAISSETYSLWWSAYLPALEQWDEMMTFEDEWEVVDVLDFHFAPPGDVGE